MAMAYDTSRFKAHVETFGSTIRPSSLLPHVTVIALASPTKAIDAFHSTSNGRQ